MKTEIIFWLNPKTGVIYHKVYSSTLFRNVGEINQFEHEIIAIGQIHKRKIVCADNGFELMRKIDKLYEEETIKDKTIDKMINFLNKLKG